MGSKPLLTDTIYFMFFTLFVLLNIQNRFQDLDAKNIQHLTFGFKEGVYDLIIISYSAPKLIL